MTEIKLSNPIGLGNTKACPPKSKRKYSKENESDYAQYFHPNKVCKENNMQEEENNHNNNNKTMKLKQ